jgi:6-phosphogluconate dehydrogenase
LIEGHLMQLGLVGLGKMGANMARRLLKAGHTCVVTDLSADAVAAMARDGATGAGSLEGLVAALATPRVVWVMVPAGEATERTVETLGTLLTAGDIVIDGGNSWFKDDVRRGAALAARGIRYVDAGTSGGVWGADRGYCLMVGGTPEAVAHIEPVLRALAPGEAGIAPSRGRDGKKSTAHLGYLHCGPVGAGHFVKMIHNGIEYGMMQAFAEGFDIMRHRASEKLPADERYDLNLADIAEVWRRGSVVTSWLLDLTASALAKDQQLEHFSGSVEDSGEGRWTIEAAIEEAVPADVLAASLFVRFRPRQQHTFAEKVLSAMRLGFGGHVEAPKK